MDRTPVSLLERLRRPEDEEAWRRFVALAMPFLFEAARRYGLSDAEAADVVQGVFSVLARKLPTFQHDPAQSFRAWMRTLLLERCRDRQRRLAAVVPAGRTPAEETLPDASAVFPGDEYRRSLALRALEHLRGEFAESTWRACWEQVVNGRPAAEVARDLGITPILAFLARSRVLARLRRELTGLLD